VEWPVSIEPAEPGGGISSDNAEPPDITD